ncbi:hypothetical protein HZS55_12700 [Halosimplex rubrum]|uniref:STAS/SEC14 domain-containing protein n=1 Tax=Halosimplex rubrum TaxID=869889 RepID=A0A7D5T4Z8_9EURY|nr:STAS/SEC14 domain-containing protein [Halosimplex rubrum]QLH78110.1 hypothetical protein HZS55_12700 [Halosimplex rubrum]
MAAKTIDDGENYTIEWDDEIGAVVFTWDTYVSGAAFREGCEALLDAIERRDAAKVLTDTRGVSAHDAEDQQWMQTDWMPRAHETGLEYSATVHSDSVISEMDVENMLDGMEGGTAEPFLTSDMAEAREWLAAR